MKAILRRAFNTESPRALLRLFISGSLITLLIALGSSAFVLSSLFSGKEQRRSQLALEQLGQAIESQYRSIADEMWTESFKSIALRIREIAIHQGGTKYTLFLTDAAGDCRYSVSDSSEPTTVCEAPAALKRAAPKLSSLGTLKQILQVNESTGFYHYMAPLFVGTVLKGYIYASFSDPYEFYRGNRFSLLTEFFLPALVTVFILWFLWLQLSKHAILNPYLHRLVESEKKEALGALAAKVAHDIRSPLSALTMVVSSLEHVPGETRLLIEKASARINDIASDLLEKHRRVSLPDAVANSRAKSLGEVLKEIHQEKGLISQHREGLKLNLD